MTGNPNPGCKGRNLARFFELRGWQVTQAGDAFWVSSGTKARWLMVVPDHVLPKVEPDELRTLLRKSNMLALRYGSTTEPGLEAGLYVCRARDYSIKNVARGLRSKVNCGVQRCEIRRVTADELIAQGLECNRDTMARQGRSTPEFSDPVRWRRLVEAAFQVPAIEVHGAFVDGELAAYALACLDDGWGNITYSSSRTAYLKHSPNHALMFTLLGSLLRRPEVEAVCGGPKTVLVEDGLHDYKTRMGFGVEPHNVVVRFHPAIEGILSSPLATRVVGRLRNSKPDSLRWQRMQAFLSAARAARTASGSPELAVVGKRP